MPKRVPISIAKNAAIASGLSHVILFGFDGQLSHCVTYGTTVEHCAQAAQMGNRLKTAAGWPEKLHAEPRRVRRLQDQVARLTTALAALDPSHPALK